MVKFAQHQGRWVVKTDEAKVSGDEVSIRKIDGDETLVTLERIVDRRDGFVFWSFSRSE